MIHASSLTLSFGSRLLFNSISFDIPANARIGLIGANGSGKSTLLEAIVGIQQLDGGSISTGKNKKIAYLAQDVVLGSSLSVLEETMTAFGNIAAMQARLAVLEKTLEHEHEMRDLQEYADLHEQLNDSDPEVARAQVKKMLKGLGFKETDFDKSVAALSIGWRMRIVLAKLLLQKADFYLFDEPTNHLDIFAKDWFLDFLQSAPFGFMLVCHERYFLDKLCKQILELELGKAQMYQGNFSAYEVQKEHNRALLEAAYVLQQKEIKQKEENIARFKASASRAKQAQSMAKQLDKMERIVLPPTLKNISFSFPPIARSGKIALKVEDLGYSFDHNTLFENVNFEIERGQKVGLVASNGGGKSTLLNLISGKRARQKGNITFGANVTTTLFDQDQNAALAMRNTVLQNSESDCPARVTAAQVRAFLGAFLFSGADVDKKVEVLSGGEKNRLGMVKVLLQNTNFLLLDEPTNHLDIDSKKILLKALQAYQGTILFVSHDRAFLNELATRIVELTPTGVISFEGNYDQFLYYKQQMSHEKAENPKNKPFMVTPRLRSGLKASLSAEALAKAGSNQPSVTPPQVDRTHSYESVKKAKALERKIDQLDQKIRQQELEFGALQYGSAAYKTAQENLRALKKQHELCMQEWELLHDS